MKKAMEAWELEWRTGDKVKAKQMAIDAVNANRAAFEKEFAGLNIPQLVTLLDIARMRGDAFQRNKIDAWLFAEFKPQKIGGTAHINGLVKDGE